MLGNSKIFQCTLPTGYPASSGLNVIVSSGAIDLNGVTVIIPTKRFTVAAISTTYIYIDLGAGVIATNTTGFATSGVYPVAVVTTNSFEITTLTDARPDIFGGSGGGGGTADSTQSVSTSGTVGFFGAFNTLVAATAGAGGITQTLPTAAPISGQKVTVLMVDTGAGGVTVNTTGGQTINGVSTYLLSNQFQYATFQAVGSNWLVVGNN